MIKTRFFFLGVMVMCAFFLLGCKEGAKHVEPLSFDIPGAWSLAEDTQRTPQHRKIALMTPTGDFAEMELLEGDQAFSIDSRDYMTRYVEATFPTEELRNKTEFEFGDVTRSGQKGYFINVNAPGKSEVRFILEFYQFANKRYNLFVVLTTNPGLSPEQQGEFDQFLGSIKLGE